MLFGIYNVAEPVLLSSRHISLLRVISCLLIYFREQVCSTLTSHTDVTDTHTHAHHPRQNRPTQIQATLQVREAIYLAASALYPARKRLSSKRVHIKTVALHTQTSVADAPQFLTYRILPWGDASILAYSTCSQSVSACQRWKKKKKKHSRVSILCVHVKTPHWQSISQSCHAPSDYFESTRVQKTCTSFAPFATPERIHKEDAVHASRSYSSRPSCS